MKEDAETYIACRSSRSLCWWVLGAADFVVVGSAAAVVVVAVTAAVGLAVTVEAVDRVGMVVPQQSELRLELGFASDWTA